jgi:hypothetical protein
MTITKINQNEILHSNCRYVHRFSLLVLHFVIDRVCDIEAKEEEEKRKERVQFF